MACANANANAKSTDDRGHATADAHVSDRWCSAAAYECSRVSTRRGTSCVGCYAAVVPSLRVPVHGYPAVSCHAHVACGLVHRCQSTDDGSPRRGVRSANHCQSTDDGSPRRSARSANRYSQRAKCTGLVCIGAALDSVTSECYCTSQCCYVPCVARSTRSCACYIVCVADCTRKCNQYLTRVAQCVSVFAHNIVRFSSCPRGAMACPSDSVCGLMLQWRSMQPNVRVL